MKERIIKLTQKRVTVVDAVDYDKLIQLSWCFAQAKGQPHTGYALTGGSKRLHVPRCMMHRFLLNFPTGLEVDHINGDRLDNRRNNLRLATRQQQGQNCGLRSDNTSGYRGVRWNKQRSVYQARLMVDQRSIYLGKSDDAKEAAKLYDAGALKYHGEYARLNFPLKEGRQDATKNTVG